MLSNFSSLIFSIAKRIKYYTTIINQLYQLDIRIVYQFPYYICQLMDNQPNRQSMQLIDQHKHFNTKALQNILEPLKNCNKDYFTVAIIGSQNTGKSTLLNHLFHTNFRVLEGLAGTRTTRGVILGRDFQKHLVVMDVEGNDSYESHLSGDENYQKMVSSFALVSANLLIVNIHEKQLGQHTGSQYETLSLVLRICIDQFKQQSPKTILFCLRDANPNDTDEGECRRKLQTDIQRLWKNVWAGTKKAAEFEKYQSAPERFFTLEVAFLREFDKDYPQQFREDVAKLRERFINPLNEGYLFRKQKKQYNIPSEDLPALLDNIWNKLATNQELNLPNEKVQLASYRCQQIFAEIQQKFEADLILKANEVRNYGEFLSTLSSQFKRRTQYYGKSMSEKWEADLAEKFKLKIHNIVVTLLSHKQKQIELQFEVQIKEKVFFQQTKTFKEQAQQILNSIIQKYIGMLRQIGIELPDRKERLQTLAKNLQVEVDKVMGERVIQIREQFQSDGQRQMQILAAEVVKDHLGLQFWSNVFTEFQKTSKGLLSELNKHYKWAKGTEAEAHQLDENEEKLSTWLFTHLKRQFQSNLGERLVAYFKIHFFADQHGTSYNFNVMEEEKIAELYSEAKQMTLNLLQNLNNFKFQLSKRSSYIQVSDVADFEEKKPFLETNSILSIKQKFEQTVNQQFYTIIRRRKQAQSKKVPWYFFLVIIYFIYDDLPSSTENSIIFKLIGFLLVFGSIPFAFGQGQVVSQILNNAAGKISNLFDSVRQKVTKTKQ